MTTRTRTLIMLSCLMGMLLCLICFVFSCTHWNLLAMGCTLAAAVIFYWLFNKTMPAELRRSLAEQSQQRQDYLRTVDHWHILRTRLSKRLDVGEYPHYWSEAQLIARSQREHLDPDQVLIAFRAVQKASRALNITERRMLCSKKSHGRLPFLPRAEAWLARADQALDALEKATLTTK